MRQSAITTPFSCSLLTVTKGRASKTLDVSPEGLPMKREQDLAIWAGQVTHIALDGLAALQSLLTRVTFNQSLVHGVVQDTQPGETRPLVTKERLANDTAGRLPVGTVARSLDYFGYPPGTFLLMLDRDNDPADPTQGATADALLALLAPLVPGLAEAGKLISTSTSSGIRSKKTGDWLTPPTGYHIYLLCRGDLQRFLATLKVRLWLAELAFCKLANPNEQTGVAAVLERAIIDLSVWSPERLDFVAGALIPPTAPFYQDRGTPRLVPGTVLDLNAIGEVTLAQQVEAANRVSAAKQALAPERHALVNKNITSHHPDLPPAKVEALIQERLSHHENGLLAPDFHLYFNHRQHPVTVAELNASYDNRRLADPAEPSYRAGSDALFHWNQGQWLINSFAHGVLRTYRSVPLPPPPEAGSAARWRWARHQARTWRQASVPPAPAPLWRTTPSVEEPLAWR